MKRSISFKVDIKPVGTNSAYRKRRQGYGMYLSDEAKSYKEILAAGAYNAMAGNRDFFKKPKVFLVFTYGDARKRDADSAIKLSLDSMNGIVYLDDSDVIHVSADKFYRKGCPSVRITVEES